MKFSDIAYYRYYRIITTVIGQWTELPTSQRWCTRAVATILILSIFTPKLIKLGESAASGDIDTLLECIPMIILHSACSSKYITWTINFEKTKKIMKNIQQDINNLHRENDIKIYKYYMYRLGITATLYSISMFSILIIYLATPIIPKILDVVRPLNVSRSRLYLYQTEYFVDEDEYYVPILIHAYCTVPVSVYVIVFYDNTLATYVHHLSGLLSILRLYLSRLHLDENDKPLDEKDVQKIQNNIAQCVRIHSHALEMAADVESFSTASCLFVTCINLFIITLTGVVGVMKLDRANEAMKFFAFCLGSIFHLFYPSYQGQTLTEESEMVFHAAYTSEWYTLPANLQKLLIPIMMRSARPCELTAGTIIPMSMNTFSIVLKNAASFFTVIHQCRD